MKLIKHYHQAVRKVEKEYARQVNGDFSRDFLALPTRILQCAYWLKRMGKPNAYDAMRAQIDGHLRLNGIRLGSGKNVRGGHDQHQNG